MSQTKVLPTDEGSPAALTPTFSMHTARALARALGLPDQLHPVGLESSGARLDDLLTTLGVVLLPGRLSCREAVVLAAQRPLLLHTLGDAGEPRSLVVSAAPRGRARVAVIQADLVRYTRVGARGLAALAGATDVRAPLDFQSAVTSRPLECMRLAGAGVPYEKAPWRRLRALMQLERRDLWVLVALALVSGLLALATPVAVQTLVNTVAFGTVLQPLVVLSLVLLVVLSLGGALGVLQRHAVEYLQRRLFVRVTLDLATRLPRLQARVSDTYHPQELVNRFFDVMTVKKAAGELMVEGLDTLLKTALGMLLMALYHPLLMLFDVLLVLALAFVFRGLGRGGTRTALRESDAKYDVAAWLEEVAGAETTFRAPEGAVAAIDEANRRAHNYLDARRGHYRVVLRQDVALTIVQVVANAALLGLGGWLVLTGQLTLGQLVAAELVLAVVLAGLNKLPKQIRTAYSLLAGLEKLGKLVDLPLEGEGDRLDLSPGVAPRLSLEGAVFDAPACGRLSQPLDLVLTPGAHVALIGRTGASQHPVLDALFGLRRPARGRVRVNDEVLTDGAIADLRHHVALVRRAEIVRGTIADNLRLSQPELETEALREALATAGLLAEVDRLPDGLQTRLTSSGSPLSPSQQMRLTLARTLLSSPTVLLIDESLDGLEHEVQTAVLGRLLSVPGRTVVVATREPSLVPAFAQTYALSDGQLKAVIR